MRGRTADNIEQVDNAVCLFLCVLRQMKKHKEKYEEQKEKERWDYLTEKQR